jgi:hypothetical protein
MKNKTTSDDADQALREGLAKVHSLRDDIARFIDRHSLDIDELIACCDENGWEAGVAFDFRAAMFQLGCVLSTLVLWDGEVLPKNGSADKILADVRKLEADNA